GVIFPAATIALRLRVQERIALNTMLLIVIVAAVLLAPKPKRQQNPVGICIMLVSINLVCFAGGVITSRNVKKAAIEDGLQRRADAREQLRIRDELRFAREVQISMLPEAPPQQAIFDGGFLDVAAGRS